MKLEDIKKIGVIGAGPVLEEKLARGELGVKSGKGFYDYTGRDTAEIIEKRDREFIKRLKEAEIPR